MPMLYGKDLKGLGDHKTKVDQIFARTEGQEGVDPAVRPNGDPLRAQEVYAQEVLTYMYENSEDTAGVLYFRGSPHMLTRNICPKAQVGQVVGKYLKGTSAITNISHGYWRVNRKLLYLNDDGEVVTDVPRPYEATSRTQALEDREAKLIHNYQALERRVRELTAVMLALNGKIIDAYDKINMHTAKMQESGIVFDQSEARPLSMEDE